MMLSSLKRLAQSITQKRGHRMRWGQVYGTPEYNSVNGRCQDCHAFVAIHERQEFHGLDISGSAVTVNCTRTVKGA